MQKGWFPFRVTAGAASANLNLGGLKNMIEVKNENTTNTIWIRLGETPQVAAGTTLGNDASYPLAPGESIPFPGVRVHHIAYIAPAGSPVLKGIAYCATGLLDKPI